MAHANGSVNELLSRNALNRKRKRTAGTTVDSTLKEPTPQKRPRWISATRNGPSLYDYLNRNHIRIDLGIEALEEFDRRDRLTPKPSTPAALYIARSVPENLPLRRTEVSADLKRFARIGGTDLSDLRGFIRTAPVIMEAEQGSYQALNNPPAIHPPASKATAPMEGAGSTEGPKKTGKTNAYSDAFFARSVAFIFSSLEFYRTRLRAILRCY